MIKFTTSAVKQSGRVVLLQAKQKENSVRAADQRESKLAFEVLQKCVRSLLDEGTRAPRSFAAFLCLALYLHRCRACHHAWTRPGTLNARRLIRFEIFSGNY